MMVPSVSRSNVYLILLAVACFNCSYAQFESFLRSKPGMLYHLAQKQVWEGSKATGSYTPPTYQQDGFTHLTAEPGLLLKVANHFYKDTQGDWLLITLDPGKLASKVVFEPAAPVGEKSQAGLAQGEGEKEDKGPLFPHLYGPLNHEAVVSELQVKRAPEDGTFLSIPGLC